MGRLIAECIGCWFLFNAALVVSGSFVMWGADWMRFWEWSAWDRGGYLSLSIICAFGMEAALVAWRTK